MVKIVWYGIISKLIKINGITGFIVCDCNEDELDKAINTCKEVIIKIKELKGKPSWYCSTLRDINEVIYLSKKCPPRLLLYMLIMDKFNMPPMILSKDDIKDEFYEVEYTFDISTACKRIFRKINSKKQKRHTF